MNRSNRTEHIRLTSHPEPEQSALPDPLGRRDRARARTDHRHGIAAAGSQRHRQSWRLLCGLPRACGFIRRARSDPPARSDQHLSRGDHRAVPAMDASRNASFRSIRGAIWSPRTSRPKSPKASTSVRPSPSPARGSILHEMQDALAAGRLANDGDVVHENGSISVVKVAIDPVWYLPGIAQPFRYDGDRIYAARCLSRPPACFPNW